MTTQPPPYATNETISPHHHDAGWSELTSAINAAATSGATKTLIIELLREHPDGLTDWELTALIERRTGRRVSHDGTKAMRNTLMRQGWVFPTSTYRAGPFGSKHKNEVWTVIPVGVTPVPLKRGQKRPDIPARYRPHLQPVDF